MLFWLPPLRHHQQMWDRKSHEGVTTAPSSVEDLVVRGQKPTSKESAFPSWLSVKDEIHRRTKFYILEYF